MNRMEIAQQVSDECISLKDNEDASFRGVTFGGGYLRRIKILPLKVVLKPKLKKNWFNLKTNDMRLK